MLENKNLSEAEKPQLNIGAVIKSVCDCGSKYAVSVAHKWFCENCGKEVEMKQTCL